MLLSFGNQPKVCAIPVENPKYYTSRQPITHYKITFGHKTVPNGFAKWCEANKNKAQITDDTLDNIKKDGYCLITCTSKDDPNINVM